MINYDVWKEKFGTCVCIKDGIVSEPFDHPLYEAPDLNTTAAIIFHAVSPSPSVVALINAPDGIELFADRIGV
ncbi:MAG: hypothetical protein K2X77_12130 [Candidatus Obscuribacterales bacterium]|nr:hypothetical protein [Candidatus Obscuribacterales bacterium]